MQPHNNNAPVIGYRITHYMPDFLLIGSAEDTVIISSTEETVENTGLHPGVQYTFTLSGVNDIGEGPPSGPERATTSEEGKI